MVKQLAGGHSYTKCVPGIGPLNHYSTLPDNEWQRAIEKTHQLSVDTDVMGGQQNTIVPESLIYHISSMLKYLDYNEHVACTVVSHPESFFRMETNFRTCQRMGCRQPAPG